MARVTCPQCSAKLTCGCQRRTAGDGTKCCQRCIAKYEAGLSGKSRKQSNSTHSEESKKTTNPIVVSVKYEPGIEPLDNGS